jgi:hypothetical protein
VGITPACAAFAKPIASERTNKRRMTDFVAGMTTPCCIWGFLVCGLIHAPTGRVRLGCDYITERASAKASMATARGGLDCPRSLFAAARGRVLALGRRCHPSARGHLRRTGGGGDVEAGEQRLERLGAADDSAINSVSR